MMTRSSVRAAFMLTKVCFDCFHGVVKCGEDLGEKLKIDPQITIFSQKSDLEFFLEDKSEIFCHKILLFRSHFVKIHGFDPLLI